MKDFKSTKEFWNFSSSHVRLKSDKSSSFVPQSVVVDGVEINDPKMIADEFVTFLTQLSSISDAKVDSCLVYVSNTFSYIDRDSDKYIYNNFKSLQFDNKLNTRNFSFVEIKLDDLLEILKEIQLKSSPGVSKIPTSILKDSVKVIGPVLLNILNTCLQQCKIPDIYSSLQKLYRCIKKDQFYRLIIIGEFRYYRQLQNYLKN